MNNLHSAQQSLLNLLKKHIDDPLTIREMQDELGVSSTSLVYHHIQQLEKRGYLRRNPSNPQDYHILTDAPDKRITYVNMYGLAHCGPRGSVLDGNPVERVPIASRILGFPADEAFMVKAKGDSMSPKINDKDLVVVRRSNTAKDGNIVVCVNKGEVLIKKIQKDQKIILSSLNPKYPPFVADDDFRIEGVVRGVYSYDLSND